MSFSSYFVGEYDNIEDTIMVISFNIILQVMYVFNVKIKAAGL